MFGPKYPSYDSLGPSLGLSWAHVRPMPMLASVRTMLTHVASRSGLGQERGRGCSCACLCCGSCLLLRLRRVLLLLRVLLLVLCSCSSSSFSSSSSSSSSPSSSSASSSSAASSSSSCSSSSSASSSSSSSSCRAWSCFCSSHMFGPKYPAYGSLGPSLDLSWPHVTPMLPVSWPYLGPMLAHLGSILAPCWPILALCWPMLALAWAFFLAIYVATPSRCQLLGFFPLLGAQNHVKTTVFARRQDKIRGRRGARNTVKNDVFVPFTQNTL